MQLINLSSPLLLQILEKYNHVYVLYLGVKSRKKADAPILLTIQIASFSVGLFRPSNIQCANLQWHCEVCSFELLILFVIIRLCCVSVHRGLQQVRSSYAYQFGNDRWSWVSFFFMKEWSTFWAREEHGEIYLVFFVTRLYWARLCNS